VEAAAHPTDRILEAYALGQLEGAAVASVDSHLIFCAKCRNRAVEMSSDTFLDRLRDGHARAESRPPTGSASADPSMTEGGANSTAPLLASSLPTGLAELRDYEILGELGRGGMGVVYLAHNKLMGRNEVLKVVSRELMNRRGVLDRFLREIRNAAQLHHPNIVTAYSAIRAGESIVFRSTVVSGQWQVERDELVQRDLTRWYSTIMFGDDQWTDYDIKVDAMQVGEGNSFSLFFRGTNRADSYKLVISGAVGTCYVATDEGGRSRILKSVSLGFRENRWYTASVHVRGSHFACFLDDLESGKATRLFDADDSRFSKGRVGLETFISSFRFKNIKVTSPDGKVLWEGLPAVGSNTTAKPPASPRREPNGWISLFNGKDKSGWKTHQIESAACTSSARAPS